MKKLTNDEFINKSKAVHGDKYDYSKVDYKNSHEKVCIICPKHGEFLQTPNSHLNGSGCPECCDFNHKYTTEEFIQKSRNKHGDKYDYSKVEYVNNHTKVCIICPKHGEFWMKPQNHLFGQGCFKCFHEKRELKYNTESIIEKFKKTHGDKYDYSLVKYTGIVNKVTIVCPEHGKFEQNISSHIKGAECPICGHIKSGKTKRLTTENFIERARLIHGDKYDYSKVEYVDYDTPVTIICPTHGEFLQTPDSHLQGKGCQSCSIRHSDSEEEIIKFIKQHSNLEVLINNKNIIKPLELDIYIPEKKIAIEFNGIRWHTEEFGKTQYYHFNKMEKCLELDIKLIQIFEDEFLLHKEIVFSKLSHLLGFDNNKPKIYGRNVNVVEIKNKEAKTFLYKNHIQGFSPSTIYLGAYYNGQLVGVMSFKKNGNKIWELNRFATDYNYVSCGVGGKLFKYFTTHYNPLEIKSFADRRWTLNKNNNLYTKLGFSFESSLPPDYKYVKNNVMQRIHKFNCRKSILSKKYNLPLTMTEKEMCEQIGLYRVWDCGLFKYTFKCTQENK